MRKHGRCAELKLQTIQMRCSSGQFFQFRDKARNREAKSEQQIGAALAARRTSGCQKLFEVDFGY